LNQFSDKLAAVQKSSSSPSMQNLPPDLDRITQDPETFASRYYEVLIDRERQKKQVDILQREQQQAEIMLQSLLGRGVSEEAQSHSLLQRRDTGTGVAARDMICRLAPGLTWLAATPALQKFLGYTIVELNNRPFLEVVDPADVPDLKNAFEKAL